MSNPCHIELILSEKEESVKKEVLTLFPLLNPGFKHVNKSDFHVMLFSIFVAGDAVGS